MSNQYGSKRKKRIPQETIRRLGLYLRSLRKLSQQNFLTASSNQITSHLNITSEQFRKDLSYFGSLGKRGVGYNVKNLIDHLEKVLGVDNECKIALVGVGKLGSALLAYPGFANFNFRIVEAFDSDFEKIGKVQAGLRIRDVKLMGKIIPSSGIKLAILTVPADSAQVVAEKLVKCGILGILNFAPVNLNPGSNVFVLNVDMAAELMVLSYFARAASGEFFLTEAVHKSYNRKMSKRVNR